MALIKAGQEPTKIIKKPLEAVENVATSLQEAIGEMKKPKDTKATVTLEGVNYQPDMVGVGAAKTEINPYRGFTGEDIESKGQYPQVKLSKIAKNVPITEQSKIAQVVNEIGNGQLGLREGVKTRNENTLRNEFAEANMSNPTLRGQMLKEQIDNVIEEWGYHLQDLQINDITFDEAVMVSMSKVVASNNLKAAAENEGQALLITKTKAAEAEGNAIKIAAQAEREAAQLRGQGVALFREEVAKGMQNAAREMQQANLDTSMIMFSMWTEAIKNFAEYGKGNVLFLDGSPEGMQKTMRQMMGMDTLMSEDKK